MHCPDCGHELAEGAKFCPNCGRSLEGRGTAQAQQVQDAGDQVGQTNTGDTNAGATHQTFCPVCGSTISPGAKFCLNCGWQVGTPAKKNKATQAAESFASKVNQTIGYNDHVDLKFKEFFVAVPRHHSHVEAERLLTCGTPETTPKLSEISSDWPRPWVYSRVFVVLLLTLVLNVAFFSVLGNPRGIPAVMFLGAALMPVTALVFFFETNVPRNISFATVLEILLIGGITSCLAIYANPLLGYSGAGDLIPSLLTGIVEEMAKAAVVIVVLSRMKDKRFILNGLLVGAAVGAGFAMFESAGYAFLEGFMSDYVAAVEQGLSPSDAMVVGFQGVVDITVLRALLAIGGHVAWAAAEGGAFALCYQEDGFAWRHVADKRFLGVLVICIVLHGTWDSFIPGIIDASASAITGNGYVGAVIGYGLLIIAIWIVLDVLLNRGLKQVNEVANKQIQMN